MFLWLVLGFFAAIFVLHYQYRRTLPPGPPSLPIVGCMPFIGRSLTALLKNKDFWAYGDLVTILLGSNRFIVINDFKLAKDLFNRDEFCGRPKSWWDKNIRGYKGRCQGIINTDGQVWVEQRRFALRQLRDLGFGRTSLDTVMCDEADDILNRLIATASKNKDSVVKIESTFNASIINVLWHIVASKRFDPESPRTKEVMGKLNKVFKSGFNPLSHIPGMRAIVPFNEADKGFIFIKDLMREVVQEHVADVDYDNPRDFIDVYLKEVHAHEGQAGRYFDIENLITVCLDFFQAGAETTSTSLLWSVLLLALHPGVQKKCQEEIDRVLGSRNPITADMTELVYVMATMMEIQRFSCTAPASLPHRLTKEATVNGYRFGEGTFILCNVTKFLLDENVFPNPDQFVVDRFLNDDGKSIRKYEQFVPFGIGKRICMGEALAKNELFIFLVKILQRVNLQVPPEQNGYPCPDPKAYSTGITFIPDPFYVQLTPRNV